MADQTAWLALVVGNSRLHWGAFSGGEWLGGWHTPHLTPPQVQALMAAKFADWAWADLGTHLATDAVAGSGIAPQQDSMTNGPRFGEIPLPSTPAPMELWLASVVQSQGDLWRAYAHSHMVTLNHIPLGQTYATLGADRALALVGAGDVYGWPVLVVDGGTALTLTAGEQGRLVGGAILPGVRSQFRALHDYTDGLPLLSYDLANLPPRWATTTAEAMVSGILYSQLAGLRDFIADWRQRYGQGQVVFTGGDGPALAAALLTQTPTWVDVVQVDANLVFWGLRVNRWGRG